MTREVSDRCEDVKSDVSSQKSHSNDLLSEGGFSAAAANQLHIGYSEIAECIAQLFPWTGKVLGEQRLRMIYEMYVVTRTFEIG